MPLDEGQECGYHVDPQLVLDALEKMRLTNRLPQVGDTALCRLCLIMSAQIHLGDKYRHINNLWNLPVSAITCPFCALVEQCIRAPTAVNPTPSDFAGALEIAGIDKDEVVQLMIRPDDNLLDICFMRQGEVDEELLTTSTIRLFTDSPIPASIGGVPVPFGMVVSLTPDLNNIGTLAKTWIEGCRSNHRECNAPAPAIQASLPTRVLDIDGVRLTGRLQLLHTKNVPGKYIALSHSWGGSQPAKTIKSNLITRCGGFPLSELPPTFRDAVAVATELGIRYIWIDSLCIVQDDPDDWKREAATMGDVYLNSYLTIAATRASNSEAGFLGPRSFTRTVKLPHTIPGVHDPFTARIYACQRRSFSNDVDDGPLNRRAWVLQERVLSPRTLHFTEHQVYWECWQHHQGEDLEYQYLGVMKKEVYPVGLSPNSLLCDPPTHKSRLLQGWWHMSSDYTSRGLTYQADKLIAIDGLVQKLTSRLQMSYTKGIWKEFPHPCVLWSARTEDLEYLPLVEVPSWSWASRKGPINYIQLYDYEPVPEFTIHEVHQPCSLETLFAHAALAKLDPRASIGNVQWSDPATDQIAFPPELDYFATKYRVIQNDAGDVLGWITLDIEIESQNDFSHIFWVLVVKDSHSHEESPSLAMSQSDQEQKCYCLLIQEDDNGYYKRVGVSSVKSTRYLESCQKSVLIA
ncbi:heterokaryon incompatibility protein-domain-containing protein [Xylaria cf. heliscus]|nr:heterokaryon incompatibility protein-domain-containing protein [Xylaria cf. heliscus]